MKKNFSHENFERFLKEAADELQMRPTADLWNRLERRLNRRRRWVYFSSAFFLLTASLFGYLIVDHSKQPVDPFAGVQTIQKKATPKPEPALSEPAATATASPRNIPAQRASAAVGLTTRTPRTPNKSQAQAQLFQTPITAPVQTETAQTTTDDFTPVPVDEHQPFSGSAPAPPAQPQQHGNAIPTIESVVNSYKPVRARRKPEFQLHFTPTISYRRLTENKSYLRAVPQNQATLTLAALYDVNSMVTHKPDMGLELGFTYKFPITRRVKLRTGMQFNMTRYDIKAFTYVPERATIALNNRRRGVDSLNTMSTYRNLNGGPADWIQNFYFQVSAPVGVEVAFNPSKKTRFGVAATIQPTYVLGERAYLISTDYKNYSQVPWLIRHWNANTSVETFVSYSTGKLRWQVGPQMRYQLLSSFVEKYPVKENLFDFGLKVGVSLDKK